MRAYRNKNKFYLKPPGWNIWGKIEVKEIMEVMNLMSEGEDGDERNIP